MDQLNERVDHLVVGAGFAGICAAIKLHEAGETDFLVIDKGETLGGTWRDNTYPGAACDIPSQLYSFSFAPNTEWSSSYSPQPEIQAYLQKVARDAGVLDRFRYRTALEDAAWDHDAQEWVVRTSAGTVRARTLIAGSGGLSEPKMPDIAGLEDFQGELFHSARWNHDLDLRGKRVAVIGTGASAIQIVPELQKVVSHLDVYQRTAPYVVPRGDRRYTKLDRLAFKHLPGYQKAARWATYWGKEWLSPGITWQQSLTAPVKAVALAHLAKQVKDPELREKLTPPFDVFCKRTLISNDYFPAVASDNVDLVTDPIAKVSGHAVVTTDGVERDVDVIVVATGFYTTELPIAEHIRGRSGVTLAETWRASGMQAYKGTTVHGFPNLFFIVGPNTGLGHSSMVFMIESQVQYIRDAVQTMRSEGWAAVEPTERAQARYNEALQARMQKTVWVNGGCSSWYLDEHGRNTTLWPRSTVTFRRHLAKFDAPAYQAVHPKEQVA